MDANAKRNNGFITIVTVGDKKFEIDGYVRKGIMESLLSNKAVQTLDWTNRLCDGAELTLSEACFIENHDGDILEVEIEEIDPYTRRTFSNCLSLSKAIEAFVERL